MQAIAHLLLVVGAACLAADSMGPAIAQFGSSKEAPIEELAPEGGEVQADSSPGRLRIAINVAEPGDLKVREGQSVRAGQVLADRSRERARLESERDRLLAAIKRIETTTLLPPSAPRPVPPVPPLPAANFAEEEAAIAGAELDYQQAQRTYSAALATDPFIEPAASVSLARAQQRQAEQQLQFQQQKLAAIAEIEGLPPEVHDHEAAQLETLFVKVEEAASTTGYREAELANAKQEREAHLRSLLFGVEKAQSALQLARSRYDRARGDRQREEYEHQLRITEAQAREREAQQAFERQKAEYAEAVREREFQLSQLRDRLEEALGALENLAVVRAPYDGVIQRVKSIHQTDGSLAFELVLRRSGASASAGTANPFISE